MLSRFALKSPTISISASIFQNAYKEAIPKRNQIGLRHLQRDSRTGENVYRSRSERIAERQTQTLKEKIMTPAGPNAFALGKGALAGGSALALGALCYYGVGLGKGQSVLNNSLLWPQYVKDRIHTTYAYFGSSVVITAASAAAIFRSPTLLRLASAGGWMPMLASMALIIGTGMVARSIPYEPGFGVKQLAWATHCAVLGGLLAPLSFVGGPILIRAAWYTAGIVGGLSTVAVCAPSDKFLYMGGPLAIGLGFVFASSIGSMFLPASTALGAGLYSISLYGGLLLFGGFLLYDTQRIVRSAETHPTYALDRPFDPVNHAISIYMDTINIFVRIVSILSGGGSRRK